MSDADADDTDESLPTVERGKRGKVVVPDDYEDTAFVYRTRGFGFALSADSNQTELPYSPNAHGEHDLPRGVVSFEAEDDEPTRYRVEDADA